MLSALNAEVAARLIQLISGFVMKAHILAAAFFVLLLAGCATAPAGTPRYSEITFPPLGSDGAIVVFREGALYGAAAPESIYVDGERIASLCNECFTRKIVSPGKHQVSVGWLEKKPFASWEIDVKAGSSFYVEATSGNTMMGLDSEYGVVGETDALEQVGTMAYIPASE